MRQLNSSYHVNLDVLFPVQVMVVRYHSIGPQFLLTRPAVLLISKDEHKARPHRKSSKCGSATRVRVP